MSLSNVSNGNRPRWDGKKSSFYEVYYLKITDAEKGWSFWARYTLLSPKKEMGKADAAVWGIFSRLSGQARLGNPATVVCAYEENRNDINYPMLHENYEILRSAKDQSGNKLNVIKLPMPGAVGDEEGMLPASYANFYIGNTVVLVPVFGHENDAKALDIIQLQFPDRKVAGINCSDLVYGLGTLHCISQQQPAVGIRYEQEDMKLQK